MISNINKCLPLKKYRLLLIFFIYLYLVIRFDLFETASSGIFFLWLLWHIYKKIYYEFLHKTETIKLN